jgi:hypothetical protein
VAENTEALRHDIEQSRANLGDTLDAIGDRVSPRRALNRRTDRMRWRMRSMRESVMGRTESVGSDMSDQMMSMRQGAQERGAHAAEAVKSAPENVMHRTEGSPLAAGLIAFGAGLVAAAVFPASRMEQQATHALMERAQPLADEARDVGQEMASHLRESGRAAAQDMGEVTREAAHEVTETAQAKSQETKETAQHAAEQRGGGGR